MRSLMPVLVSVLTVLVAAKHLGQYCKYNGRLYKNGNFKFQCNKCRCGGNGKVVCSEDKNCVCIYRGTPYQWGKSWQDGCRECRCIKGFVKCEGCDCKYRGWIYKEGEIMPDQGSRCCYCLKKFRVCKRTYCQLNKDSTYT